MKFYSILIQCFSWRSTGRYGNANRPNHSLLQLCESKQASSLRKEGGGAGGAPSCCVGRAPTKAVCVLVSFTLFFPSSSSSVKPCSCPACITSSLSCLCVKLSDNHFAVNSRSCGDREGGDFVPPQLSGWWKKEVKHEEKPGTQKGEI